MGAGGGGGGGVGGGARVSECFTTNQNIKKKILEGGGRGLGGRGARVNEFLLLRIQI